MITITGSCNGHLPLSQSSISCSHSWRIYKHISTLHPLPGHCWRWLLTRIHWCSSVWKINKKNVIYTHVQCTTELKTKNTYVHVHVCSCTCMYSKLACIKDEYYVLRRCRKKERKKDTWGNGKMKMSVGMYM